MTTPNNLPAELSSFVGRTIQLAELRRLIRRSRLITLTGPGGAGKTRLALRLASTLLKRYPGGAWIVELGPLGDPTLLEGTVAAACGLREETNRPALEFLTTNLTGKRTLLIFDGCEHLVDACAGLAGQLLRACPDLTLLVSSREPLGVRGELIWRIPPLSMPTSDRPQAPELLTRSEAVQLFVDRARLALPEFSVHPETSDALAEVCIRLEGLPLAIELAASMVDVLTPHEIRERLSDRFRLLSGSGRSAVPRYQTLRQAIDSSYELLSSEEKALFARLGVFAGGFDLAGAEAINAAYSDEHATTLATLRRLVDKSLVVVENRGPTRTRYRLLDTIREYALEKLEHEDLADARGRHATHYFEFCKEASTMLLGREQAPWLERMEEEAANVRLALAWWQEASGDNLMLMTGYVHRYWYVRGKFKEGLDWLDRALEATAENLSARLSPLQARARLRRQHGDVAGSWRDAVECEELARVLGSKRHLMGALTTLGILSSMSGRWSEAERFGEEVLQLQEEMGGHSIAVGLNNLALLDSVRGNHEAAKKRADRALKEAQSGGDRIMIAQILETSARIERRMGHRESARTKYLQALSISLELEDVVNIADVLDGLALLAVSDRDPKRAMALIASSSRLRMTSNSERAKWEGAELEAGLAQARAQLDVRAADAAWRRGSALKLKEAALYASGLSDGHVAKSESPLTPREMQVGTLISDGLTNIEIAGRLKISPRTADAHVEHIRNKLGVRTRAQIAVWAHERLGSS